MIDDFISVHDAAARHDVTERRIQILAAQGRIPGARKVSGVWLLPPDFSVLPPAKRKRAPSKIKT